MKQFLRKLLFSFYLKILPFSPLTSMGFQISLWKFHKNSLSEWLLEWRAATL
ncbi:nef attachable domain protein [Chlamydia psittaci 08DC60]|nr:nef attachable domain protein [Chlamydia psittaci 08DC60]